MRCDILGRQIYFGTVGNVGCTSDAYISCSVFIVSYPILGSSTAWKLLLTPSAIHTMFSELSPKRQTAHYILCSTEQYRNQQIFDLPN